MPSIIKYYVNTIDYISLKTGRATMYLVFVMMFILILSFQDFGMKLLNKVQEVQKLLKHLSFMHLQWIKLDIHIDNQFRPSTNYSAGFLS